MRTARRLLDNTMEGSEMKSRWKRAIVLLCAMSALAAFAAGQASAAEWVVNKAPLSGSAALSETVNVVEPIMIDARKSGFEFKCTKAKATNGEIIAKGTIKLTLGYDCETVYPTGETCDAEEAVLGYPIEGALTKGTGSEDGALFTTKETKQRLWRFGWGNVECGFGKSFQYLMGTVTLSLPSGQTEAVEQKFSFLGEKESPKGMTFGTSLGNTATVTGKIGLKLKSGLAWAFR
jgi:hypothetical protein